MQRGPYNSVTTIPVLIACSSMEGDETVNLAPPQAMLKGTLVGLCPVRVLQDANLDREIRSLRSDDKERLLALIALRQALEGDDRLSVEKREAAYRRVMHELLGPLVGLQEAKQENFQASMARLFAQRGKSLNVLERLLTHAVRNARLIIWRPKDEGRLLPAIHCPDVATALYVRALVRIAGGKALVVCPNCGNLFLQQRSDQDYCSIRCREAHRVARWRAARGKRKKIRKGKRIRKRR